MSTSIAGKHETGGPAEHLHRLAGELNTVVAECMENPQEEAVHRVRTGSRRVEALLETILRMRVASGTAADADANGAAARWLRQLKKVRRAAGQVRDLDVHRGIVAKHFLKASESTPGQIAAPAPEGSGDPAPALKGGAQQLDDWLKKRRHKYAAELALELKRRQPRLEAAEHQFVDTVQRVKTPAVRFARPAALLAVEDFLRLVDRMPVLDAENLHDFRKGAKKARYVAETGGEDSQAAAVAKAIKRVQDEIGDWHDWLVLGEEAQAALGKDGAELHAAIEAETARLYTEAIATTERLRNRLLGEWLASKAKGKGARPLRRKAPGTAASPVHRDVPMKRAE